MPSVWNFGAKPRVASSSPAGVRRRFAIAGANLPGAFAEFSLEEIQHQVQSNFLIRSISLSDQDDHPSTASPTHPPPL
jgi:hypothetical protein